MSGELEDRDPRLDAALFAWNGLDDAERETVARRFAQDPDFAREVADWETRLAHIAISAAPDLTVPSSLWDRIDRAMTLPSSETVVVFRAKGFGWEPAGEGLETKTLTTDEAGLPSSILIRMQPRAIIPSHFHDQVEECVIVEGDLLYRGERLIQGDLMVSRAGGVHEEMTSPSGGLLYVRYLAA